MLRYFFFSFTVLSLYISCSTNVNQYGKISDSQKQRNGKWIEKEKVDNDEYVMKGRYKMGEKSGVWKTYFNGLLYQKDRIKGNITTTKVYFPSGKIMEKGQSKLVITDHFRHWFYFGDWKYYDENGAIKYIKKY